ncbi:MAG: biotin--[acetyl-CoA-carboxylase] ligase [Hyphomicrobiaceae bacterium]
MAAAIAKAEARWVELEEVDSTNAEAMRRALAGERGPLYIRADRQTAGRGRSGRVWEAPTGNLALSRLGRTGAPAGAVPQLSLVAGVAVYKSAAAALGLGDNARRLLLKWPNDVLLDGAKLAGILVEATTVGGEQIAVIGIGLNVAHAPEIPGRRTAALAAVAGPEPVLSDVTRDVARHLDDALALWDEGRGFDAIRHAWLSASTPKGTAMTIENRMGQVTGFFRGLDADGALVLVDGEGRLRRYAYGDVTLASEQEMS